MESLIHGFILALFFLPFVGIVKIISCLPLITNIMERQKHGILYHRLKKKNLTIIFKQIIKGKYINYGKKLNLMLISILFKRKHKVLQELTL